MTLNELVEQTRPVERLDVMVEVAVPMENGDVDVVPVWGTSREDALDNARVAYCVDCYLLPDRIFSARA